MSFLVVTHGNCMVGYKVTKDHGAEWVDIINYS